MYEIYEKRLVVTQDGIEPQNPGPWHEAAVWDVDKEESKVTVALSIDGAYLFLHPEKLDADGDCRVLLEDFSRAVGAVVLLDHANGSEREAAEERVAGVIERVCEALGTGDPYRETLATDLRTTVLDLMTKARAAALPPTLSTEG